MHESLFPLPLAAYVNPPSGALLDILASRIEQQPVNLLATAIFLLAILHTFFANAFRRKAHHTQHAFDERCRARGEATRPSVTAEMLHFLGEVEVVFGLWVLVLLAAITVAIDWPTAHTYITETVHYTEPMFVVVIMAMAATRPIVGFAQACLHQLASLGGSTPAAWWFTILTIGPLLGSFITEPAAMTICAHAARTAVLRAAADTTPALRHARPALRERVHRRHPDPFRGASRC